MKIVVFGPDRRVGALREDKVIDLNRADSSLPAKLDAFIEAGQAALDRARRALETARGDAVVEASSVKLHAPWPGRRIAMVGGNYADHLAGMLSNMTGKPMSVAEAADEARKRGHWGFWKSLAEVTASGDEVPYPGRTRYLDYEGEMAIVIGRRGKDIRASDIGDYVWGVTLANDWSIRDNMGTPFAVSYNLSKNFDGSLSLGPCIVAGGVDCNNVDVETRVNGELRQRFNTRDMVFSFAEVLEHLSRDLSFVPGDIISGGTAAGTAADTTRPDPDGTRPIARFLKVGDVVEISSPAIGVIRNRVA